MATASAAIPSSARAAIYRNFYAMSFETEGYLDAVSHPNFASTAVTPQKPMHEVTVFNFSTR
jgi:hypothetical protein